MVVSEVANDQGDCSISGQSGVLVDNVCYVLIDVLQHTGLGWFKALSHCESLDSSLASIHAISSASLQQLVSYLGSLDLHGQPFWIGLRRRPWVWVEEFDPGKQS